MGMFDTVKYTCPNCDEITEYQTKLGECTLSEYNAYSDGSDLPPELITGLARQHAQMPITCSGCRKKYRLMYVIQPMAMLQMVPD